MQQKAGGKDLGDDLAEVHEDFHKSHHHNGQHHSRGGHGGSIGGRRRLGGRRLAVGASSGIGVSGLQGRGLAALGIGAGVVGVALQDGGGLARAAQPAGSSMAGRLVSEGCAFQLARLPEQSDCRAQVDYSPAHLTKGQMVAGWAEQADLAEQSSEPTTAGVSVARLRIQVKP